MNARLLEKNPVILIIFLSFLVLVLSGCTPYHPPQTIVERPSTTDVVKENESPTEIDTTPKESGIDYITDDAIKNVTEKQKEIKDQEIKKGLEAGTGNFNKKTAAWAHKETFDIARGWSDDARLFGINCYNLREGMLTDTHYYINDRKVYQSYFTVSYISAKKENREILDLRVNWDGASSNQILRYLPGSYASDYRITEWEIDTDRLSQIMNKQKEGAGYFIKLSEIVPAELVKKDFGSSLRTLKINIDNKEIEKREIYKSIKDSDPIGIIETHYNVIYEVNLKTGKVIGYYEKTD